MIRRYTIGKLAAMLLIVGALTACSGANSPEPTPTPIPTLTPTSTPVSSGNLDSGSADDQFALGEKIFKEAAAEGVGCQYCHGSEGYGDIGPNIRGKSPGDIRFALDSIDAMSFIHLNEEKVEAVATYLQWLATQQ